MYVNAEKSIAAHIGLIKTTHRYIVLTASIVLVLMLSGCNVIYENSRCNDTIVRFQYHYNNADRFDEYIFNIRYFLFDSDGIYAGELEHPAGIMSEADVTELPEGNYTVIALANLHDYATLTDPAATSIANFRLKVSKLGRETGDFANGDPLFWGEQSFRIGPDAKPAYIHEMSCIHCVLSLRVEWEDVPEYSDGYRFRLIDVGSENAMDFDNGLHIGEKEFPEVTYAGAGMTEEVPLRRFALQARLTTLRYSETHIPDFQLYHDDKPVLYPVSLSNAFKQWGWHPDTDPVQEYEIRIVIHRDGSITLHPSLAVNINDWEDGGTLY